MRLRSALRNTFLAFLLGISAATAAAAQTPAPAKTEVCITIDETHDTLSATDRSAARLMLARQFEVEGWHVVSAGCSNAYVVSHVRLGYTITVVLAGPGGHREGVAHGLDDLLALYSQMVRSIVTGRTMEGMNVIDRTNVTMAQTLPPRRVSSDSFGYTRLGAGNRGGGFGFGHRAALDSVAIDVSFLNFTRQIGSYAGHYRDGGTSLWTLIKLEGLHYADKKGNNSLYFGGGASYGGGSIADPNSWYSWSGFGFQGEGTVGYEIGRASTLRIFVQGDITIPLYEMTMSNGSSRYVPSFAISVGFGWQRQGR